MHTPRTTLSVRGLHVSYGEQAVLKDVNVDFPDRSLTAIIGPSGCGKTTLLRTLNRLIDNTEGTRITGEVLLDGQDIYARGADVTGLRRKMGLLSQRPTPLPMSIFDNVAFGMRIHGERRKQQIAERVEYFLRHASLWEEVKDRLHQPAGGLSIGQQQRLCLARGLAVGPEVILGDEPTSALDPISTRHIEDKFAELKERYAIIIVTHVLRQARRLADHIVFMYLGEVVEQGPAEQLFNDPQHELTRAYISGSIS
ncbi:MAG: phosphate ABC transporter ATP-binding protein [Flavobacteriales bacterium]